MPDELDAIPWASLTHAGGSAADVPDLLRALRATPRGVKWDESPLSTLFTNIWHQGTVYEATAYAVPFLLELAADPRNPLRVDILHLLSVIAQGTSYLDVHGNVLNEPDFEAERARGSSGG